MPDFIDMAQMLESLERQAALSHALNRPAGPGPILINGKPHCRECVEPIPAARLKAVPGTGLCVHCASFLQQRYRNPDALALSAEDYFAQFSPREAENPSTQPAFSARDSRGSRSALSMETGLSL